MSKHKFKPGDLVRHTIDNDLGIVIDSCAYLSSRLILAYKICWIKDGLQWENESVLKLIGPLFR